MAVDRTFQTENNEGEVKDWFWYDCGAALPLEIFCVFVGMRYWNVLRVVKLVRTINLPVYLKGTLVLRERLGQLVWRGERERERERKSVRERRKEERERERKEGP